ncbi:MAG TPA: type I restriction enzyme HsdR N-terminal domain-containing protein [Pirellulaceae bacterium]|jgi:predicted type IV restriction endonuclease
MPSIPKKINDRLVAGIKKFQPILESAKTRDIGESDTVTIVVEILADVFGFDKFTDLTSEQAIKGTHCDLAVSVENQVQCIIEVKAVGIELKDAHVKQAVDYAANHPKGIEWVILTNGICWRVYSVVFGKPIGEDLVLDFEYCLLDARDDRSLELLNLLCKESWHKSLLDEFHVQKQALSRFFVGAMLVTDPVIKVVRKELKKLSPDVRVEIEELRKVVLDEVIKREVMEGDKADEAKRKIAHAAKKALREAEKDDSAAEDKSPTADAISKSAAAPA